MSILSALSPSYHDPPLSVRTFYPSDSLHVADSDWSVRTVRTAPPPPSLLPGRKRRRAERSVFSAEGFGGEGFGRQYGGAFRTNVRKFLEEYGQRESVDGLPAWSIMLETRDNSRFPLLVLEEEAGGRSWAHCDHCRCIGWSHHPVSSRRYHFVVPAGELDEGSPGLGKGRKKCHSCGEIIPASVKLCACCGAQSVRLASGGGGGVVDLTISPNSNGHRFHGVLHSNGFGHILQSQGSVLMTLWDNICGLLRARKVSVEDTAQRGGMEMRLLNSVAEGGPWYRKWGYGFGHGSYGVTRERYEEAVETLRQTSIQTIIDQFAHVDSHISTIIQRHQCHTKGQIRTMGDLFRHLSLLQSRLPPLIRAGSSQTIPSSVSGSPKRKKNSSSSSSSPTPSLFLPHSHSPSPSSPFFHLPIITEPFPMDSPSCRWSSKRLELAQEVIVGALKERALQNGDLKNNGIFKNNREIEWMPRHEVREMARQKIGDTGLLDFVLKSLGNRQVGRHVVRRAVNPETKVLEFSLEDVDKYGREGGREGGSGIGSGSGSGSGTSESEDSGKEEVGEDEITRADVSRDIAYLYTNCLESYARALKTKNGTATILGRATQVVLDTKQFIKDYQGEVTRRVAMYGWEADDCENLRVMCKVIVEDEDKIRNRPSPPAELVVLPPHATIGDLKMEAEKAFQDTYCIMRSFQVERVVGLEGDDDDPLFGSLESGTEIIIEGYGLDRHSEWRYEGGSDSWVVACPCGARDDDGERMIACDACETWQHTRCGGIEDATSVPHHFLCDTCRSNQTL